MHMRTPCRLAMFVSLCCLTAIQSCSPENPAPSSGEDRASADVSVEADRDRNRDVWWHQAGEQDMVAVTGQPCRLLHGLSDAKSRIEGDVSFRLRSSRISSGVFGLWRMAQR